METENLETLNNQENLGQVEETVNTFQVETNTVETSTIEPKVKTIQDLDYVNVTNPFDLLLFNNNFQTYPRDLSSDELKVLNLNEDCKFLYFSNSPWYREDGTNDFEIVRVDFTHVNNYIIQSGSKKELFPSFWYFFQNDLVPYNLEVLTHYLKKI
jgi:hypothetical protein